MADKQIELLKNEINIYEIFQILISKIYILAFVALIAGILGFIYNSVFTSKNFSSTLEFYPITTFEEDKFNLFNSIQEDGFIETKIDLIINSSFLIGEFANILRNKDTLYNAFKKLRQDEIDNKILSEIFIDDLIKKKISNIEIKPPSSETLLNENIQNVWSISFTGSDEEEFKKGLKLAIEESFIKINENLNITFQNRLAILKYKLDIAKSNLIKEIENLRNDHNRIIEEKILYLTEQAKIARSAKIDTSINPIQYNKVIHEKIPDYYRGYLALEKEIEILKTRENKDAFVEGLFEKEIELRKLNQSDDIILLTDNFNSLPINEDDFRPVIIDVELLKVNYIDNLVKIMFIFLFVSVFSSCLIILFIDGYKKSNLNLD